MKKFLSIDDFAFRPIFYTAARAFERREREPFPPVNVYVCDSCVLVQALLPGLDIKDVNIWTKNGVLHLEGVIPRIRGRYFREERYTGKFHRVVPLGSDVMPASQLLVREGIFQITFPKK